MYSRCIRQYALAQSYLRDKREAKRALQRALDLTKPSVGDSTNLSAYCTTSYVEMEAALCLLALGNPRVAAAVCDRALEHWQAELVRDESLCLARLSVARCQLREIEEACATAQRAVERVVGQRKMVGVFISTATSHDEAARAADVAVLPIGSSERHGGHVPLASGFHRD